MPRQQNPALNWKSFKLFTICASKTRKGLKWIQNILIDLEKAKSLSRVCSHRSLCTTPPYGVRDSTASVYLNHFNKAAPFLKVNLGVCFWQKGCLDSRGEEQARRNRFTFCQDFVSYMFDSTPNARLHKHTGVELFKLHTILCCSFTTAQPATKKRTWSSQLSSNRKKARGDRLENAWLVFPPPHDAHIPHWVWETPAKLCAQALSSCLQAS